MFGLGGQELIFIIVIILIFFGAEKIPELAKSFGKGAAEFRQAQQEFKEELKRELDLDPGGVTEPGNVTPIDAPTVSETVLCPSCRGGTPADGTFCSHCGKRLPRLACDLCGRSWEPGYRFCPGCGRACAGEQQD